MTVVAFLYELGEKSIYFHILRGLFLFSIIIWVRAQYGGLFSYILKPFDKASSDNQSKINWIWKFKIYSSPNNQQFLKVEQKKSEDVLVLIIGITSSMIAVTVMVCFAIAKCKKKVQYSKTSFDAEANSVVV